MSQRVARVTELTAEQEARIIDAITALDWNTDPVAGPSRVIAELAARDFLGAERILIRLSTLRHIEIKPEHPASNFAETGRRSPPVRSKWFRPIEE